MYFRNKKLKLVRGETKKPQINNKNKNTCIIEFCTVIH
jgi:hypothetical protein